MFLDARSACGSASRGLGCVEASCKPELVGSGGKRRFRCVTQLFSCKAQPSSVSMDAMAKRAHESDQLREHVQRFVRGFGLLAEDSTPCGTPLSPREAHALMTLLERERQGTPLQQTELGAVLGIDKSNVTRLVQRLSSAGRVEQTQSELDGRARLLRLTAKGKRLAESVEASSRQRFATLLAQVPAGRRKQVIAAMQLLAEALSGPPEEGASDART